MTRPPRDTLTIANSLFGCFRVQPDDPQPSHYASSDNVGQATIIDRIKEEEFPSNGTIIRVVSPCTRRFHYTQQVFQGKDKVNVHKRSSSDSQAHLIPKSPPLNSTSGGEEANHHQYNNFNNDDVEAALLPKN